MTADAQKLKTLAQRLNSVLIGKPETVKRTLVTVLARGHLLIEDVPGIGKTLLGLALAKSIDSKFNRVQFTNDLLPSDILGVSLYEQNERRFDFRPGPIFTNVLLADEINRSTPKTQSALLEAMSERQVTVDGKRHPLEEPFFVIATENPVEYHGTFPLPEAQLDRFLMRVQIGYPTAEDEALVLKGGELEQRLAALAPVLGKEELIRLQNEADKVHAEDALLSYVVSITRATREHARIRLGASPRGSQALLRAARAHALLSGRDFMTPDDVKAVAAPVLAHRIVFDGGEQGLARVAEAESVILEITSRLSVPS